MRSPWLALALALGACGGDEGPSSAPLVISASAGTVVTDTIGSTMDAPLVAKVTRDGRPVKNIFVTFDGTGCGDYCVAVGPINSERFSTSVVGLTDAQGTASVRVQLGYHAGPAPVQVMLADSGGVPDTVMYQVGTGSPALLEVRNQDTSMFVGRTFTVAARVTDVGWNTLSVPVEITSSNPGVASVGGSTVSGVAFGYTTLRISASAGTFSDSTTRTVVVVPTGKVVMGRQSSVQVANADGSGRRDMTWSARFASWSPDGSTLAAVGWYGDALFIGGLNGTTRQLLPAGTSWVIDRPAWSRDGSWIYFGGRVAPDPESKIWRVHPDGTGLESVSPSGPAGNDSYPSPAPDGRYVVWQTTRGGTAALVVADLVLGTTTQLVAGGTLPAWSPLGAAIAYWTSPPDDGYGVIHTIPASGGSPVDVPTGGNSMYGGTGEWTTDGQWLVARTGWSNQTASLLRVSDGLLLSLPWVNEATAWSWSDALLP